MTLEELLDLATAGRTAELRQALAEAPAPAAEALVRALAERFAAQVLAELDAAPVPPPARKRVRAALHVLRTRGVPPPAISRVAPLVPVPAAEAAEAAAAAWIAVPPPAVHLVLASRDAAGRRLLVALLDEQERVVDGGRTPHASARGVRELVERGSVERAPFVPLPAGHVVERMRAAVRRSPSPHGPRAAAARAELAEALAAEEALVAAPHPARELAPADPRERASVAATLAFSARDLPFEIDESSLTGLVERLNALRHSPLVVSPGLEQERQADTLRAFVERDLAPDLVAGLGLRLLDRAWVRRSEDAETARRSAAAGLLLLEGPASPEARAVLRAFVEAQLRPPDDRHGVARAAEERRSRGGLILP